MADSQQEESRRKFTGNFLELLYNIVVVYLNVMINFFKSPERKSIRGQIALITGSGHGLGREMAIKLAQQGCDLALVDINEENNSKVKREINRMRPNSRVFAYQVDIRDESNVAQLASQVRKDLGDVDILINNAGIVQCLPFLELSPTLVERTFQVNVMSHFWTIKQFLPSMIKNERGHVVAISSIAGIIGSKYLADYCASKFAVNGLMESLEKEVHYKGANENVHFTTICPASMSTGMFQTFTSRFDWLLPVLSAEDVTLAIMDAVLTNQILVAVPPITLFLHKLSSIIPSKVNYLVQDYLDYGVKPHKH